MEAKGKDYRVLGFHGENFKRLKVVDITPDANSVIIAGPNEAGKSSIIDGIQAALGGKDSLKDIPEPIRRGEDKADLVVDLGDLVVTRRFTQKDSYLKVTSREGASYKNPQAILNELFNKATIDPSVFLSLDEEKQFKTLKSIVKMEIDIDQLEQMKKGKFDERTVVNKEIKSLQARFDAKTKPEEGLPAEEKSASEIVQKIQEVNEIIAANKVQNDNLLAVAKDFRELKAVKENIIAAIKSLTEELEDVEYGLTNYKSFGEELKATVETLVDPDVQVLSTELSTLEETNKKIKAAKEYSELEESLTQKKQEAEKLTAEIEQFDKDKAKYLAEAEFPIEGLGFGENGITFKGIPFTQCSQEERIKVALAIAMAQNPKLKVIFIRDASLIDEKNFALIQRLAKARNYQVWYEVVKTDQETGIIIEDGTVKSSGKAEIKEQPKSVTYPTPKESLTFEKPKTSRKSKASELLNNSMFE